MRFTCIFANIVLSISFRSCLYLETPPPGYMSEDGDTNEQSMDTSQSGSKYCCHNLFYLISNIFILRIMVLLQPKKEVVINCKTTFNFRRYLISRGVIEINTRKMADNTL